MLAAPCETLLLKERSQPTVVGEGCVCEEGSRDDAVAYSLA